MKTAIATTFAGVALLAGCAEQPPFVTQYNEASVTIRQTTLVTAPDATAPAVVAEARRICGVDNRRAEYASTSMHPDRFWADHLFLCLRT